MSILLFLLLFLMDPRWPVTCRLWEHMLDLLQVQGISLVQYEKVSVCVDVVVVVVVIIVVVLTWLLL